MLQKIFLCLVALSLGIGSLSVYQQRADSFLIEKKKENIVLAHNAFYPDEWSYSNPIQQYERDGLTDVLKYYERDDSQKKIYFYNDPLNYSKRIEIQEVDYDTFTPIDQSWSRDRTALYRDGKIFMKTTEVPKMMIGGTYMKNTIDVYYWWEGMYNSVEGANPNSFESLYSISYYNVIPYGRDDKHVYMLGEIIKDMDPQSVEILTSFYIQDKKSIVYFDGEIYHTLKNVHRKSFKIVS